MRFSNRRRRKIWVDSEYTYFYSVEYIVCSKSTAPSAINSTRRVKTASALATQSFPSSPNPYLPELGADLVAALAGLKVDDLSHGGRRI